MEKALWYLLTATRGGENRVRVLRALSRRPKNANELAEELDVDYKTVRHHLDMLTDHGVVETSDEQYAKLHFLTDEFEHHRETFEEIAGTLDLDDPTPEADTEPEPSPDGGERTDHEAADGDGPGDGPTETADGTADEPPTDGAADDAADGGADAEEVE